MLPATRPPMMVSAAAIVSVPNAVAEWLRREVQTLHGSADSPSRRSNGVPHSKQEIHIACRVLIVIRSY